MTDFKASKIIGDIATLTPEPDTLYLHRIGSGFDLYAANQAGVLQKLNHPKELISGVGRPDIPTTLSAENQHECNVAENGALFTSTDGAAVGALQWQKTDTGWVLLDGDTGWIDLRKTTPIQTCYYKVRRVGNIVHLILDKWAGNRFELPYGFTAGDNYYQFVAPLLDGTTRNAEVSATGSIYLLGSNQAKPWNNPSTVDDFPVKNPAFNNTWKIIRPSEKGLKMYIQYATPDPYPTTLPTPQTEHERLNTCIGNFFTDNTGIATWQTVQEFGKTNNTGDFIVTNDLTINFTFPRPTLSTSIEIRGGLLGANINGAKIWYSADNGTTWIDSSIVTSGHVDNDTKQNIKTYQVEVANITNISLRKTGMKLNSFLISCKEYAR